ncbi:hypothetical protein BJV74DRAFT_489898 [Russula compacta]|nr:hypothetical protein BJV74DRAFT_489898 [Russula compacta]
MSTLASANRPSSVGNASAPARKRTKNGKMSSTIKRTHKRRRSGKRPGSGIQRVSVVDTGTDKIKHAHDTDENLAMRYLSKIQERYPTSQSDKYAQFSMIWLKYREGVHNGSIERRRGEQTERDDDVYAQVRELFKDEEDLVSGFEPFMTSSVR